DRAASAALAPLLALTPEDRYAAVQTLTWPERRAAVMKWLPSRARDAESADAFDKGMQALLALVDALHILARCSDERAERVAVDSYRAITGVAVEGIDATTRAKL